MSEKQEFEYAEKLGATEVADYLMKIAEGLKGRNLTLNGKGQTITLLPDETVKLKVKAEAKEGKGEIEFEIGWKEEYVVGAQKLEIGTESEQTAP